MSSPSFYMMFDARKVGPLGSTDLRSLVSKGILRAETMLSMDGRTWRRAISHFPEWFVLTERDFEMLGTSNPGHALIHPAPPAPISPTSKLSPALPSSTLASGSEVLKRLQVDANDTLVLLKEALLVCWRLNPIGIALHDLAHALASLREDTHPSQQAVILGTALRSSSVDEFTSHRQTFLTCIEQFLGSYLEEVLNIPQSVYPQVDQFLRSKLSRSPSLESGFYVRQVDIAISGERHAANELVAHFRQIHQYLPRYEKLMNRSELGEWVLAIAALMIGDVGYVGAGLWDHWRNSSDSEFLQKFQGAILAFLSAGEQFMVGNENTLNIVLDRIIEELGSINAQLLSTYQELAGQGWDLKPLYQAHRKPAEDLDDGTIQLLAITLRSLSQNRSVSGRQLHNLIEMTGVSPAVNN